MPKQPGWRRCTKCKGLFKGFPSVCPDSDEHNAEDRERSLVRNENRPASTHDSGWRRCTECAVLFSGAPSLCPETGADHSADEPSRYVLKKGGTWNRCGECKALFSGSPSLCPGTGNNHDPDGNLFALDL